MATGKNLAAFDLFRNAAGLKDVDINTPGSRHSSLLAIMSAGASRVMPEEELKAVVAQKMPAFSQERDCQQLIHDFYLRKGNRPASCITALMLLKQKDNPQEKMRQSPYVQKLDSLMKEYSDLRECGELAIERYNCMEGATDCCQKERYDFINYALAKWGEWPRMNILRNALAQLTLPSFSIKLPEMVLPNRKFTIRVDTLVNLHQLNLTITRVRVNGDTQLDPQSASDLRALKKLASATPAFQITRNYYGHPVYEVVSDTIDAAGLKPGMYLVEATADANMARQSAVLLHVSDVALISRCPTTTIGSWW